MPESSSPPNPPPRGLKLVVQPLTARHLPAVEAIERTSFATPWKRELFEAELRHRHALPLAAVTLPGQVLAGYLCLWLAAEEVQVQNLAVHPAFRRRGVGRHLLVAGLDEARRRGAVTATLEVRPSNRAALALYRGLGFTESGRRPGYYAAEKEDALLLDCDLTRPPWPPAGGR